MTIGCLIASLETPLPRTRESIPLSCRPRLLLGTRETDPGIADLGRGPGICWNKCR